MQEFYQIIMSTYNAAREKNSFSVLQFCKPDLMVTYLTFEILFQGLRMLPAISLKKTGLQELSIFQTLSPPETGLKRFTNVTNHISSETGLQEVTNVTNLISFEARLQGFMNVTNPISFKQGYK